MYSEANRRETFTSWPHAGYRWAQPDPMAQAGFYHQVSPALHTSFISWVCKCFKSLVRHFTLLSHSLFLCDPCWSADRVSSAQASAFGFAFLCGNPRHREPPPPSSHGAAMNAKEAELRLLPRRRRQSFRSCVLLSCRQSEDKGRLCFKRWKGWFLTAGAMLSWRSCVILPSNSPRLTLSRSCYFQCIYSYFTEFRFSFSASYFGALGRSSLNVWHIYIKTQWNYLYIPHFRKSVRVARYSAPLFGPRGRGGRGGMRAGHRPQTIKIFWEIES